MFSLSKRLDLIVDGIIYRELQNRLSDQDINNPNNWRHDKDDRLASILEEMTLDEVKEQIQNFYNECLIDYLKEKHSVMHFLRHSDYLISLEKNGGIVVINYGYLDYKPEKATVIERYTKDSLEEIEENIFRMSYIYPPLELKIMDITSFIIKQLKYKNLMKISKGMKYKTLKERTTGNRREFDVYGIAKYLGQEEAMILESAENKIRKNFETINYT